MPYWFSCGDNINATLCLDVSVVMGASPIWIVVQINLAQLDGCSPAMLAHALDEERAKKSA